MREVVTRIRMILSYLNRRARLSTDAIDAASGAELFDEPADRVEPDGLDEVRREAGDARALVIGCLTVPGDRDDLDRVEARDPAQPSRDLVAVDLRKTDVEHRHLGPMGAGNLQGGRTVRSGAHAVPQERERLRQKLARVAVVIDDEDRDAAARGLRPRAIAALRPFLARRGEGGQAYDELAAAARSVAVGGDAASVHAHEVDHDRQPEAEATLRAIERLRGLDEHVEDRLEHRRRDADSAVTHFQLDRVLDPTAHQLDVAAGLGVLRGVREE